MEAGGGFVRAGLLGLTQGVSLHDPLRLHHALHTQNTPTCPFSPSPLHHFSTHTSIHACPSRPPPSTHSTRTMTPINAPTTPMANFHHPHTPNLSGSAFSPLPAKTAKMEDSSCSSSIPSSSSSLFSPALLASLDPRTAFLSGGGGGGGGIGVLDERRDSPSPRGSHGSRESPGHARDTDTPNSCSDEPKGTCSG
ncbi:hypothetical protein O3P69_012239 [Scylla paramamosain]|uniref:Uncharacterized protein n=1 Tax=Scylla paramamosain TaxID=85552 RepID=A0AAW0TD65_SCYPA